MPTATMSSKGQITIPLEIREKLGLHAGTRIDFIVRDDHSFEAFPITGSVSDLFGIFQHDGPPKTLEEMDEGIGAGAAESMRS